MARGTAVLLLALAAIVLLRLAAMAWLPLMDTTEARYAEIGRKMLELGDWITPWHDYGVPFWAKPPLSFWLTAASMKLLGVSEFAARLPHFLCIVGVALSCRRLALSRHDTPALASVGLLAGAALSFAAAGAVMTDAALVWGTTLAMRGFWLSLHGPRERIAGEQRVMLAGLVIGLLAKGPLALVLVALPVGAWALWTGQSGRVRQAFAWGRGFAAIALGAGWWYAAAELKTPGFLDYFIVGEHWHRFVTPGWSGDHYGFAHAFPPGTIWAFALVSVMPWPPLLWAATVRHSAPAPAARSPDERSWFIYLACWALAPLLFFTAARNIILPYALPALPAMALLASAWLARRIGAAHVDAVVSTGLGITLAATLGFGAHALSSGEFDGNSAKAVIAAWQSQRHAGEPVVFVTERLYSATFYSTGRAQFADSSSDARQRLAASGGFAVLRHDDSTRLADFHCITRQTQVGPFVLLRLPAQRDAGTACPHR